MTGYVFIKADHLGPDCVTTYNDVEVWSAVKPPAWTENMASAQAREMPSAVAVAPDCAPLTKNLTSSAALLHVIAT